MEKLEILGGKILDQIRIINLRSLSDTGMIELKPLTVLVGKNSSGKSTFLRTFPLLKQTVETQTNDPILWYSQNLVDFGSFDESVNKLNENKSITFEFVFESIIYNRYKRGYKTTDEKPKKHKLSIIINKNFIEKVKLHIEDHSIELMNKKIKDKIVTSLKVNDNKYTNDNFYSLSGDRNGLIPQIYFKSEGFYSDISDYFIDDLHKNFSKIAYKSTSKATIFDLIGEIKIGSSDEMLSSMQKSKSSANKLMSNLKKMKLEDVLFSEIRNSFLAMNINSLIMSCNIYLSRFFSSLSYIAPLRASAERYYRIQGISVDKVDSRGENLPMILQNMNKSQKKKFNEWTKENFNFEVDTDLNGGHTSLKIIYQSGQKINLADTGFGYSQILPILLSMWKTTYSNNNLKLFANVENVKTVTIVIEQPELHLHPALQSKLIDTFVKLIMYGKERNINLKFIIETHSESIINRIGYLISKNQEGFNENLSNILIFDNEDNIYKTKIKKTSYNKNGIIKNWPLGFFGMED